jgi:hypothetical protein
MARAPADLPGVPAVQDVAADEAGGLLRNWSQAAILDFPSGLLSSIGAG